MHAILGTIYVWTFDFNMNMELVEINKFFDFVGFLNNLIHLKIVQYQICKGNWFSSFARIDSENRKIDGFRVIALFHRIQAVAAHIEII